MTAQVTKDILAVVFSKRMLVTLLMGFSCGLPLPLTDSFLKAWMKSADVDLALIGMMSLVGLPYTLKFLWGPVFDRYTPSFLGRRRGWLLLAQILLMAAIAWLSFADPLHSPVMVVLAALFVTFFSASQDIIVDAYRREDLPDQELGLGSSFYVYGYRIGMLLSSGGGLIMAQSISYPFVFLLMSFCMLPGIITTFWASEPKILFKAPKNIKEAVVDPLIDFFGRQDSLLILAFILLYKIGDTMAGAMTIPFYLEVGFSEIEIGTIVKLFGFWAVIIGSFLGGIFMLRFGIYRSLWIFGFLQAASTAFFAVLFWYGHEIYLLSAVIAFENFSSGMGTAAYIAFMASLTNKKFTATQYALFTSLMGIPRVLMSAPTGYMAKYLGWDYFFIICAVLAIPGMLLLFRFASWYSPIKSDPASL